MTKNRYRSLYWGAEPHQLFRDTSAAVIQSDVAIDPILASFPQAKVIVMVRDPVATVRSFHGELLHNLNEDVANFECAWRLQAARAEVRLLTRQNRVGFVPLDIFLAGSSIPESIAFGLSPALIHSKEAQRAATMAYLDELLAELSDKQIPEPGRRHATFRWPA